MRRVYSPSEWGACLGLTSCLFWSRTSENSKQCSKVFRRANIEYDCQDKWGTSWHTRQRGKQNVVKATQQKMIGQTAWQAEVTRIKKNNCEWLFFIQSYLSSGMRQLIRSVTLGQQYEAHIRCELWSSGLRIRPGTWIGSPHTPSCDTHYSGGLSSGSHFWRKGERQSLSRRKLESTQDEGKGKM